MRIKISLILVCLICLSFVSKGQIDKDYQVNVIKKVKRKLLKSYPLKEKAKEMTQLLDSNLNAGVYNKYHDHASFSQALTQDMFKVSKDLHLALVYRPVAKIKRDSIRSINDQSPTISSKKLSNNIGYLKISNFSFNTKDLADNLAKLKHSSALIIDLQDNYGGYAELSNYLISYFVNSGIHYATYFKSNGKASNKHVSKRKVKGSKLLEIPIVVLINENTFSAGETFAYNIQAFKRAIVIGKKSLGGAHPKKNVSIDSHFFLSLPIAYSINLFTNTDWEGKGVIPNIIVENGTILNQGILEANKLAAIKTGKDKTSKVK